MEFKRKIKTLFKANLFQKQQTIIRLRVSDPFQQGLLNFLRKHYSAFTHYKIKSNQNLSNMHRVSDRWFHEYESNVSLISYVIDR